MKKRRHKHNWQISCMTENRTYYQCAKCRRNWSLDTSKMERITVPMTLLVENPQVNIIYTNSQ